MTSEPATYPRTANNQPSRHAERATYDVATVHSILDAGMVAHVGFVHEGRPQVLPMLYVRAGEAIYLHASTGAHMARLAARRGSIPIVVEVTLVDEIVCARAAFSHSVNYRSVIAHGDGRPVTSEARKREVLDALVEHLLPGRGADARPPAADELRKTAVLELALDDVSAKVRTGDPIDAADDLGSPCWAGVRPIHSAWGAPRASADLAAGIAVPAYLAEGSRLTLSV